MNHRTSALVITAVLLVSSAGSGCSRPAGEASNGTGSAAPTSAQLSFGAPEEALAALVEAVTSGNAQSLQNLLGPGSGELASSGDAVADQRERENFLGRYRSYHELAAGDADDLVLLVGEDRWPLPMPLVRREGKWRFDGAAGAQEIVYRRIGANELRTIDVMRGYVQAQNEYASSGHDGAPAGVYARRLRSDPGTQNGLYWEVAPEQAPSPAGPFLAAAAAEGYGPGQGGTPYHGYLYRMLDSQGAAADGGARGYLANGKLTGGFALLAYPATYGASGIMTFMVNQDGTVWQRDLGSDTAKAAHDIQQFNPGDDWTPLAPEG
jgi:DUF2950 family protein